MPLPNGLPKLGGALGAMLNPIIGRVMVHLRGGPGVNVAWDGPGRAVVRLDPEDPDNDGGDGTGGIDTCTNPEDGQIIQWNASRQCWTPIDMVSGQKQPNNYEEVRFNTTWTVPTGVTEVFVWAVGGGQGGGAAYDSYELTETDTNGDQIDLTILGDSGVSGIAGSTAFRVFEVSEGDSLEITIGSGGSGGTTLGSHPSSTTPEYGDAGGDTTVVVPQPGGNVTLTGQGGDNGSTSSPVTSSPDAIVFHGSYEGAGRNSGGYGREAPSPPVNTSIFSLGGNDLRGNGGSGGSSGATGGSGRSGIVVLGYYQ